MSGIVHKYDLVLDTLPLTLVRDEGDRPMWQRESIPLEEGQQTSSSDRPHPFVTCHFGGGYARFNVQGCYDEALNVDCSIPGVVILGPKQTDLTISGSANVSDFFEIGGKLYVLAGRYCKRLDPSDDSVKTPNNGADGKDFGAGAVATKAVLFEGNAYIGFSSDTPIEEFSGSAWDNVDPDTSSATVVRAKYWGREYMDEVGDRLWAAYSSVYVRGCATGDDPLKADDWSPATPHSIGDSGHAITGMVSADNRIYVAKTNGLYDFDSASRFANILKHVEQFTSSTNGVNTITDGRHIYYPHETGLIEYSRESRGARSVQPYGASGSTSRYGRITAQTILGKWHYVALYDGTDTWIMKGRYPDDDESMPQGWMGPMIWHDVTKLASVQCDALKVCGLTTPARLYYGRGANAGYIKIAKTSNPLVELSGQAFAATGSLYLSPINFMSPGSIDDLVGFDIENEGFTASNYVNVYVSFDGGSCPDGGSGRVSGERDELDEPSGGGASASDVFVGGLDYVVAAEADDSIAHEMFSLEG